MHTPETQQKFIERRAQGWTYTRIASELGVAKSTLLEWSRKFRFDLQNRRVLELDELRDRLLGSRQARAARLSERLAKIEGELANRTLADVSTARLYSLAEQVRRQIAHETDDTVFVAPVKDIPAEEYVEEIQQWQA